jgi:hypothetical protein
MAIKSFFFALTSCLYRDALLSCFPGIQHLMCFFHIKQACQKQLHGKPMKDHKEMLKDLTELHLCASFDEYNSLYCRVFAKWCMDYNEFAYYFEQQWNTGRDFTNWKVFSYKPGVCTTNNALESFYAMFKCSYMHHSRHTLPASLDIIMEALIVDLSREVMHGHKVFHTKHTPNRLSFANANSITTDNYVILVQHSMVKLTKKESNSTYHVDVDSSSCTCKYFHNKGYCKHLVFSFQRLNKLEQYCNHSAHF